MALLHCTCVKFIDKGILIMGCSGSGKSDLALRLMNKGAVLISDDYVDVRTDNGTLWAYTPKNIEGLIEVRGVGLMEVNYEKSCELHIVLELVAREDIVRMPEKYFYEYSGCKIPLLKFDGFAVSSVAKIKFILNDNNFLNSMVVT
jgi:HPr kinase/phosphorylase